MMKPKDTTNLDTEEALIAVATTKREASVQTIGEFEISDKGVFKLVESEDSGTRKVRLCDRLNLIAQVRDKDGDNWGVLCSWLDADKRSKEWSMPKELLAGDGAEIFRRLLNGGLHIESGRGRKEWLLGYLNSRVSERGWCVSRVGWTGHCYILPNAVFGSGEDRYIFQSTAHHTHAYRQSGTLEIATLNWPHQSGQRC